MRKSSKRNLLYVFEDEGEDEDDGLPKAMGKVENVGDSAGQNMDRSYKSLTSLGGCNSQAEVRGATDTYMIDQLAACYFASL